MNILTFVMTILMLLSMMTYARLETYRSNTTAQKQFEIYMTSTEKQIFSTMAEKRYKQTKVQTGPSKKTTPKSGTPRLSWSILLDPEENQKDPPKAAYIADVSKKLMFNLFASFPLFQKEYKENPAILDLLLATLLKTASELPEEKKITELSDLVALDLQDESLNHLFYTMIKETPIEAVPATTSSEAEDEEDELAPAKGTICLLDHITVSPKKTRLYLASKPLLHAILPDPESVNAVLKIRYELYLKVINEQLTADQASGELKAFLTGHYPFLTDAIFDFRVSKTNPRTYE